MSQREFEVYLSLLTKLLNLNAAQRNDVADELRDHMEERTARFVAEGCAPEEAVRRAVEELGDAAALAHNLSRPRTLQRRRRIARWGLASAVALGIAALVLWPSHPPEMTTVVVAQDPRPAAPDAKAVPPAASSPAVDRRRAAVEKKLDDDSVELSFKDAALRDVLAFLSEALEVPILVDRKRLNEEGVTEDTPVTISLKRGDVSNRTALDLILDQVNLIHSVREGVIIVTTHSQEALQYEVRVYPCSDLLSAADPRPIEAAAGPPMGPPPIAGIGEPQVPRQDAQPSKATHPAGQALRDVIMSMTGASWQDQNFEGGDLREYGGMMIVRHKQDVHRRIEELLAKMRQTQQKK